MPTSVATPKAEQTIAGLPVSSVVERIEYLNMLIYGWPGVGKTRLAGSASLVTAMSPVLFVDIEGGTKSLRKVYPEVQVVRVKDSINSGGTVTPAWVNMGKVVERLRMGDGGFKTIVIDNLSEATKICMQWILRDVVASDPSRDPDIPAMRDWGKSSEQIRKMVRAFRDLDAHVIFTAHEQTIKDDRSGALYTKPALPGKLADEIPGYMDEVFCMRTQVEKEEVKRFLLTQPNGSIVAKDRSAALPTIMHDPTMADLAALILDK